MCLDASAQCTATATSNSPINAGGYLQLSATGGTDYSWTGPNGFSSTEQNPAISSANPFYAGVYTVTATGGGCTATATTTVNMVMPNVLNGTYTINQNAPATTTNFTSFNGAAFALNTAGITGPITINVVAGSGPYNQHQLWLTNMPGSNLANTVTINGNGQTINLCGVITSRDIIRLDGTDNININGLVLNSTCNYGWGIHLRGNISNVTLANNTINLWDVTSTWVGHQQGIVATNSDVNPQAAGGVIAGLSITGNTISNGYYGIRLQGVSAQVMGTGILVSSNTVSNAVGAGIDLRNISDPTITGNLVHMRTGAGFASLNSTGIVLAGVEDGLTITSNKVANAGSQGLFLQSVNQNTSTPGLVANNMLAGGFQNPNLVHAVQLNSASYLNIYHNSTLADNGAAGSGMYLSNQYSRFINLRNNSFAYTGPGPGYAMQANNGNVNFLTLNNNNYYTNGAKFVRYAGADRATLTELQNAPGVAGHDMQSMAADPFYLSTTDLHLQAGSPLIGQGAPILGVFGDFDGQARTSPTDIGADEYTAPLRARAARVLAKAYPNPFSSAITLNLNSEEAADVQLVLTDLMGRVITTQNQGVEAGASSLKVSVEQSLPQGVYLLQVTQGEATSTFRVVKQ